MGAAKWVLVPVKSDASSRRGFEAVANRLELVRGQHDGVTGYNPEVGLLEVVLVGVGTNSTAIRREARHRIVGEDVAASRDVFESTIRHSEATAQATRETGQLAHELDDQVSRAPKWYQIRRGEATAPEFVPRSATNVADDLQAVTEELVARLASAETEGVTA